jgi:hypothetical protein
MKDKYFDNTRISEFRSCPRKFYFRHVKDWTGSGFSAPLAFGSAWHSAMDTIWPLLCGAAAERDDEAVVQAGYASFVEKWVESNGTHPEEMGPEEIEDLGARTPFVGMEMLYEYVLKRRKFLSEIELLSVEQPFAVPLDPSDPDLFYVGRLDKVFRYRDDIIIGEHKTTSLYKAKGGFRSTFLDQWSPNSQVDGYLHAVHILYGDKAKQLWIDGALVHRKHHDEFIFIPIERQFAQLDAWLWETRNWISQIDGHWEASQDPGAADHSYMAAFPKNTSACQDFARNCSYIDLCKAWSNPLKRPTPQGFIEEAWSPFDRLELDTIGMKK